MGRYILSFLQQRRKEAGDRLLNLDDTAAFFVSHGVIVNGFLNISVKNIAQFYSNFGVVDKGVGLKIETEAPDVKIAGTDSGDLVIHDKHFGVEKAIVINVDSGPVFYELSNIGESGPVNKDMVRFVRDHYPHVDTGQQGDFKSLHDTLVCNKIRALD